MAPSSLEGIISSKGRCPAVCRGHWQRPEKLPWRFFSSRPDLHFPHSLVSKLNQDWFAFGSTIYKYRMARRCREHNAGKGMSWEQAACPYSYKASSGICTGVCPFCACSPVGQCLLEPTAGITLMHCRCTRHLKSFLLGKSWKDMGIHFSGEIGTFLQLNFNTKIKGEPWERSGISNMAVDPQYSTGLKYTFGVLVSSGWRWV